MFKMLLRLQHPPCDREAQDHIPMWPRPRALRSQRLLNMHQIQHINKHQDSPKSPNEPSGFIWNFAHTNHIYYPTKLDVPDSMERRNTNTKSLWPSNRLSRNKLTFTQKYWTALGTSENSTKTSRRTKIIPRIQWCHWNSNPSVQTLNVDQKSTLGLIILKLPTQGLKSTKRTP